MKSTRRVAIAVAMLAALVAGAAERYRGNTKSHVFHQSSCRHYTCKNCTATFNSASEAVKRGYRPCGICRPGGDATQTVREGDAAYSGNTSSRKFHRSSCRYYACKNCTAKFDSRKAAIDAGYAPGGCCDP